MRNDGTPGDPAIAQLYDSVRSGYWHARDFAFFQQPVVRVFEWARLPGDILFIVGGILPIVYLAVRMFLQRRRYKRPAAGAAEPFTRPGR